MPYVLDSSVTLAWLLHDEASEDADMLADQLQHASARVPGIWALEVRNALLMATRRGRLSETDFQQCIGALSSLPIDVDSSADLDDVVTIAHRNDLTVYDATYLELAVRSGLPLATFDVRLRRAGSAMKIAVLPQ